jgi:hypothetical protein
VLLVVIAATPSPEIACELDVDLATPTPVPVDDWAHAGSLAAIATMAANTSRFMCSSPCAGEIKLHDRPPTATRREKAILACSRDAARRWTLQLILIYLKFYHFSSADLFDG